MLARTDVDWEFMALMGVMGLVALGVVVSTIISAVRGSSEKVERSTDQKGDR